jgi:hypothetical protein
MSATESAVRHPDRPGPVVPIGHLHRPMASGDLRRCLDCGEEWSEATCVCGEPTDTRVRVDWADGPRTYRYCAECASDIEQYVGGTAVLP